MPCIEIVIIRGYSWLCFLKMRYLEKVVHDASEKISDASAEDRAVIPDGWIPVSR